LKCSDGPYVDQHVALIIATQDEWVLYRVEISYFLQTPTLDIELVGHRMLQCCDYARLTVVNEDELIVVPLHGKESIALVLEHSIHELLCLIAHVAHHQLLGQRLLISAQLHEMYACVRADDYLLRLNRILESEHITDRIEFLREYYFNQVRIAVYSYQLKPAIVFTDDHCLRVK